MDEWTVEWNPTEDHHLGGHPEADKKAIRAFVQEIALACSLEYPEGHDYQGLSPGLETKARGSMMVTYLADVRGERIVVVQVTRP